MKQQTNKRTALFWASVPIAALAFIIISWDRQASSVIASTQPPQTTGQTVLNLPPAEPSSDQAPASTKSISFSSAQVTGQQSISALNAKLGEQGMGVVLKLNRLDRKHLRKGVTLVLPDGPAELMALSPFPRQLEAALSLPKLILVSREAQAFGAYESGKLVHWGPTSTGKKSTQTPAGLFHTNWRKKETRSSVNPAWILPWAFNLDNLDGIAFHQYDLPGFPASHGCVRLLSADAQWIYGWADTWILSKNAESIAAYGTPVIIFGDYAYGKEAPWKRLPGEPEAASVTTAKAEGALNKYLPVIEARAHVRETLLLLASTK